MRKALFVSSANLESVLGRTILWRSDVQRTFVTDPEAAFEAAGRIQPSLVVIARSNGHDLAGFIRRMRVDPNTRSTAIVVLLASAAVLDDEPLREAGANLVLSEQVDPALWDTRLWELLNVPDRREAQIPVRVRHWSGLPADPATSEGLALNISVHGILLESTRRLEVGTNLDLQFRLPDSDEDLHVVGQVVRQEAVSRSGIKFLVLRGDAREQIRAFVDWDRRLREPGRGATTRAPDTPESEQWEGELHASEARKAAILEAALDCIITIDHEGRILDFNPAAARTFGYARAEVMGERMADLIIPPRLRKQHQRGFARYLATREGPVMGRRMEMAALRADGSEFPVELTITPLEVRGRRLFTGYVRDITERKRAESTLATQYAVTRVLAEAATLGEATPRILQAIGEGFGWEFGALWIAEAEALRCVETWSAPLVQASSLESAARGTAFGRGQGLPGLVWEKGQPLWIQDLAKDPEFLRKTAASRDGMQAAVALPLLLGGQVLGVMEFFGSQPRPQDADLLQSFLAMGSQVGQFMARKQSEEAAHSREAHFRALVENSADATALLASDGRMQYVSPSATRVLGYSADEQLARAPFDLVHPDDAERMRSQLQKCVASPGVLISTELRARHKDGRWRWIELDAMNRLHDPDVCAIVANYRDVTERKLAEELLWENATRLQEILKSTPIVLWAVDREGVFTLSEGRGLAALGLKPGQVLGRSAFEVYREQPQICEAIRRALAGEELSAVVEVGGISFDAHYAPVRGPESEIVGASGVAIDITDRRKAEQPSQSGGAS